MTVKAPTPDGDIEREILHPANAGSVYHMTKTLDQLMFAFYAKTTGCGSPTCSHPGMSEPRMFISVAFVVATRASTCAGSTRTMTPPSLLEAMAMLPRMRKASPPNIFFSVSSGSLPMSCRLRRASSWS